LDLGNCDIPLNFIPYGNRKAFEFTGGQEEGKEGMSRRYTHGYLII
jgi:hypothetical protein